MKATFQELMQASYEEVGVAGAPLVAPLWLRRLLARLASYHPLLFALLYAAAHWVFGGPGRRHPNPLARDWCRMAWAMRPSQALRLARAVAALDRHPTFRDGARAEGARNCLESFFLRSGALDVMFARDPMPPGPTQDDHQRPYYRVPGIPAHRYYARGDFPWARKLEESYPVIRQELEALLRGPSGFGNYQTEYDTSIPGWNTFSLWLYGQRHSQNAARCPHTAALLETLPGFESGEWILFSALNPYSRIPPHVGPMNGVLRGHLAMLVPPGCGLRVGGQESGWEEGRVVVFDDSFVHEVWNLSERVRIVLFLNFWHPCLSEPEREALAELRRAYHDMPAGQRWLDRQQRPRPATL